MLFKRIERSKSFCWSGILQPASIRTELSEENCADGSSSRGSETNRRDQVLIGGDSLKTHHIQMDREFRCRETFYRGI